MEKVCVISKQEVNYKCVDYVGGFDRSALPIWGCLEMPVFKQRGRE